MTNFNLRSNSICVGKGKQQTGGETVAPGQPGQCGEGGGQEGRCGERVHLHTVVNTCASHSLAVQLLWEGKKSVAVSTADTGQDQ